jgi:hypothetical protein
MTITLNLPPEKEAALKAQAQARGLSLDQWMLEVADQHIQPVSIAYLQKQIQRSGRDTSMHGLTVKTAIPPFSRMKP